MIPAVAVNSVPAAEKLESELLRALVRELSRRGRRVAVVKNGKAREASEASAFEEFRDAGAAAAGVLSGKTFSLTLWDHQEEELSDLAAKFFPSAELVLAQGFMEAALPRILILSDKTAQTRPSQKGVIATVNADPIAASGSPTFSPEQTRELGDLLESYIIKLGGKREVKLFADEEKIFIKPFIKDLFLNTISALVKSLKGTDKARLIQVVLIEGRAKSEGKNDE